MPRKSPSLRDVAKVAGVSAATVSLALRNHSSIPATTRERIRAVAAEMGYLPNSRVAELMNHIRRNRSVDALSETVALVWCDFSENQVAGFPYLRDYERGAHDALRMSGYGLECHYQDPDHHPERLERILRSKGVRGLILAPLMRNTRQTLPWNWTNFSVIISGSATWQPDFNRVSFNHFAEMAAIMQHLHAGGFHRIGLVVDSLLEARSQHTIVGGFWAALETDVPKREAYFEAEPDRRADFLAWLQRYQPDALIVAYRPALEWINEADAAFQVVLRTMQDLPNQTTYPGIWQNFNRLGQVSAEQLIGQLQRNVVGIPHEPLQTSICGTWRACAAD